MSRDREVDLGRFEELAASWKGWAEQSHSPDQTEKIFCPPCLGRSARFEANQ